MGCIWTRHYREVQVQEPRPSNIAAVYSLQTGSVIFVGNSLTDIRQMGVVVRGVFNVEAAMLLEKTDKPGFDWLSGKNVESGVRLSTLEAVMEREGASKVYYNAFGTSKEPYAESTLLRICKGLQKNPLIKTQDDVVISFNTALGYYSIPAGPVSRFAHQNLVKYPHDLANLAAYQPNPIGNFSSN